ncbi:MAG: hypothetical protein ACREMJ_01070 [Gemmatimonadales bacterium]
MMFNRSKALAVGLLVAVFAAGGVVGWAWEDMVDDRGRNRRRGTDAIVDYLGRELDFRPAQRESVRAVFVRHRAAVDSIWQEAHPRVDSVRAQMRREISAQLDSGQRERYARLIAERGHQRRKADSGKDTSGGRK